MKHSDKNQEFDNLFKDAFEGQEMQPSERVWMGIEKELDKNKKGIVITWVSRISIAASIVLVIGVGLVQLDFFGNKNATENNGGFANASKIKDSGSNEGASEKKLEKISRPMQPSSEPSRLVDVVEIKSKTTRSSKVIKKAIGIEAKVKTENRSQSEKDAIELLKKLEEKAENTKVNPVVEPETKRPIIAVPVPVPSPSLANNAGSKTEIGVVEMLNYVAKKVSGNEESKLVAINEDKAEDGAVRKRYEVDLGIVKFSRVRNTK